MKKHFLTLIAFLTFTKVSLAQVGVNSDNSAPHPSAQLDVKSTDKGLLIPRLTTIERNAIQSPEIGLMVFDRDLQEIFIHNSDGWKQGTLSKLPFNISGSGANVLKVTNTNLNSNLNLNTTAEFINNDKVGIAIKAESSGDFSTMMLSNSNGSALSARSEGNSYCGYFYSTKGIGLIANAENQIALMSTNNSTNTPTAIFTNNGGGIALDLNSTLRISTTGMFSPSIQAQSFGILPTVNFIASGSGVAILGTSNTTEAGYFNSTSGKAIVGSTGDNSALYAKNNSDNSATARFINNGSGPAMELNSDLNITTNNQTGLSLISNNPATTFQDRVGALTINHTGLYGNGLVAITKYGVALTGIGTESGGTGIRGFATTGDGGYFYSENGRAISGNSSNNISIQMSNTSLNFPAAKFQNYASGGTALELNGNLALNGKINQKAYQTPTFENNWNNFGGEWNTAKFYKGKDSRVYLEGVITGGSSFLIYTLPVGYRPANRIFFIVSHNGNSRGRIDIAPNGEVRFEFGSNNTQVGLDGISFRVE